MNAYYLPYLSLFTASGCIILRCVCFILIFPLNYQQGARRCCICIGYKIMETKLWTNLDLAKVHRLKKLNSPYIYRFLSSYLILNNILTLPILSLLLKLRLIWHDLYLACFLPARFMSMRASLRNQNKCKSSKQVCICIYSAAVRST